MKRQHIRDASGWRGSSAASLQAGQRGAFTLVELLTSITLITLIGGVCALLLGYLLRIQMSSTDSLMRVGHLAQLRGEFVADAHRADEASLLPTDAAADRQLRLNFPDGDITYTFIDRGLERRVGDSATADLFPLNGATGRFQITDDGRLARLEIIPSGGEVSDSPSAPVIELDAAIGRDDRYSRP